MYLINSIYIYSMYTNLCLRGGLGWWFGSLRIDGFVNLEKKYQTLQTMKSLKIKKTNLKQQ